MRSIIFLMIAVGLVNGMAMEPRNNSSSQSDSLNENDYIESDWAFATLDEAYDPDDPAIKDLPEMDTSTMAFTDYDTEMNATNAEDHTSLSRRGLVSSVEK